jgi:hypothetical protein
VFSVKVSFWIMRSMDLFLIVRRHLPESIDRAKRRSCQIQTLPRMVSLRLKIRNQSCIKKLGRYIRKSGPVASRDPGTGSEPA